MKNNDFKLVIKTIAPRILEEDLDSYPNLLKLQADIQGEYNEGDIIYVRDTSLFNASLASILSGSFIRLSKYTPSNIEFLSICESGNNRFCYEKTVNRLRNSNTEISDVVFGVEKIYKQIKSIFDSSVFNNSNSVFLQEVNNFRIDLLKPDKNPLFGSYESYFLIGVCYLLISIHTKNQAISNFNKSLLALDACTISNKKYVETYIKNLIALLENNLALPSFSQSFKLLILYAPSTDIVQVNEPNFSNASVIHKMFDLRIINTFRLESKKQFLATIQNHIDCNTLIVLNGHGGKKGFSLGTEFAQTDDNFFNLQDFQSILKNTQHHITLLDFTCADRHFSKKLSEKNYKIIYPNSDKYSMAKAEAFLLGYFTLFRGLVTFSKSFELGKLTLGFVTPEFNELYLNEP